MDSSGHNLLHGVVYDAEGVPVASTTGSVGGSSGGGSGGGSTVYATNIDSGSVVTAEVAASDTASAVAAGAGQWGGLGGTQYGRGNGGSPRKVSRGACCDWCCGAVVPLSCIFPIVYVFACCGCMAS